MTKKLNLAMFLATAGLCASTQVAQADQYITPGMVCRPKNPATTDHALATEGMKIYEDSAVYCPVMRDKPQSNINSIKLHFSEIGACPWCEGEPRVTCTLYARSMPEAWSYSSEEKTRYGVPYGTITWTTAGFSSGDDKTFAIKCDAHAGTRFSGIEVDEE